MAVRTELLDTTFAHHYGINRGPDDDWYDPLLHRDTALFIDPFLLFNEEQHPWHTVHDRLIEFFNEALHHVARARRDRSSTDWRIAASMFSFPEPPQFCLGFGRDQIFGAGSSQILGKAMLEASQKAIEAGIERIERFSDLMLFGSHFGLDRIGDMVCNIVKDLFVEYTQTVAAKHEIPTVKIRLHHVGFDFEHHRWRSAVVDLPSNPLWHPDPGVLLTPERFLDDLPSMEGNAFWDWVYDNRNAQLRQELGYTVTQNLDRKKIIEAARSRPKLAKTFGAQYVQAKRERPPTPYEVNEDPKFKREGFELVWTYAEAASISPPRTPEAFCAFIDEITHHFKWVVEERGMWKDLWSKDTPLYESRTQRVFHNSVLLLCKKLKIDVSPETNAGNGPVDFKFTADFDRRAIVEVKHAGSKSFWDNLEEQPTAYMNAEDVSCGIFLVVQHEDAHCESEFMNRAVARVKEISAERGLTYKIVFVDARRKESASKRKRLK